MEMTTTISKRTEGGYVTIADAGMMKITIIIDTKDADLDKQVLLAMASAGLAAK
jgi:hypothetical protein